MVKSEQERAVTLDCIRRFEESVRYLSSTVDDDDQPTIRRTELGGMLGTIRTLKAELAEYDDLKAGRKKVQPAASFADLPRLLIQTRIALGVSQQELAQRIGVEEEQMELYEEYNYDGAKFGLISKVIDALRLNLKASMPAMETPEAVVASR